MELRLRCFLEIALRLIVHAIYGEYNALVSIESLEIIEGDLPSRAQKLVLEWATLYQQDLLQMWNTQEFRKLPPLK